MFSEVSRQHGRGEYIKSGSQDFNQTITKQSANPIALNPFPYTSSPPPAITIFAYVTKSVLALHNKQNECNNLLFSDPIHSPIPQPTPAMAALTNRRRTLPPDDVGSQAITADSVSANYLTTHHLANGKTGLRPPLARQESLRRNIEHVAAETYLITRLAFTLLRYLG